MPSSIYESSIGPLTIRINDDGSVESILFGARGDASGADRCAHVARELDEYFRGQRRDFQMVLAPKGTEFQLAVWRELQRIPYGATISYGELARRIGKPDAVRAVGAANGANPIPIVIPCHRVIGANGTLTGYGGGLHIKRALLALENPQHSLRDRASRLVVAAFLGFATLSAHADTLGDLKGALTRLTARQPVRATYSSESLVKASGRFSNQTSAGTVAVEVAHDAKGVTITIPQSLVEKASAGAAANEAAQNALGSIRSTNIVEALDYRESLLAMLNSAKVVEEKRLVFRGKPARLLVLKLTMPTRRRNTISLGTVKVAEDRLSVWVADDNLPIAAERSRKTTAGFLVFTARTAQRTTFSFAHTAGRLILARLETTTNGSAVGQKIDESSVQTITVH